MFGANLDRSNPPFSFFFSEVCRSTAYLFRSKLRRTCEHKADGGGGAGGSGPTLVAALGGGGARGGAGRRRG